MINSRFLDCFLNAKYSIKISCMQACYSTLAAVHHGGHMCGHLSNDQIIVLTGRVGAANNTVR